MSTQTVSVWIPGDQLLLQHPAIQAAEQQVSREQVHIVLIESVERIGALPYQRKKIVLLLSAMRHYVERLRTEGYQVDYRRAQSFVAGLKEHCKQYQSQQLFTMAASEYDTRIAQQEQLQAKLGIPVQVLPSIQFLVDRYNPLQDVQSGKRVIMEHFYRAMRKHYGVLMEGDGKPAGGDWNYDELNRKPLPHTFEAPQVPTFAPDELTREVMAQVETMDYALGHADDFGLAVTHEQAQQALDDFIAHRLPDFGPYEDAMSVSGSPLYHSQLSPYVNIGLLEPMELIHAAETAYRKGDAPLQSVEGFIRQILGWREFMYWQYWQQMPGLRTSNSWNGQRHMPQMFWDGKTDMNCIHHVASRVLDSGYNNHIERLMIVCNFCLLAGVDPAEVSAWFLSCYFDAYDWVVLPNVIGMGMNSDGGRTATKPYIASAKYINRMSDYCQHCRFSPNTRTGPDACPYNFLYWNFLVEHEEKLRSQGRLGQNVLSLRHLDEKERISVAQQAKHFLDTLEYYNDNTSEKVNTPNQGREA